MTQTTEQADQRSSPSLLAILRRRWWVIALIMIGAVGVTLLAALAAPPVYRSSLRLQTLALDEQEVTLFTNRRTTDADDQIFITQNNFRDILQSPLIAWRTINDLGLDMSADQLLEDLNVAASAEFVTVSYEADSPQQAFDTLTRHVENALEHFNELLARPATATGQFLDEEMETQSQVFLAAQDQLLQFQLEYGVGDLIREINATQDVLRNLKSNRGATQVEGNRAEALAGQWTLYAEEVERELAQARQELDALGESNEAIPPEGEAGDEEPQAEQAANLAALETRIESLNEEARRYRSTARNYLADAAAQQAAVSEQDLLISQRTTDLTQLLGLSGQYNELLAAVQAAEADFEFLRAKAAEARLKEQQVSSVGPLQIVEPAVLPASAATSPILRLVLLAALISLLLGLVLVLLLELVSPTSPDS
jgi:uncharacterized protein involved in exopolysaccharide biosynthesis